MKEEFKYLFDLSKPRRCYYSDDCGLVSCPECGSPLVLDHCTVIIAAKSDTDEAEFMSNYTGSHFCSSCPVVVFDSHKVEEATKMGIRGHNNLRYIITGIVDLNAIPEEKRHLEIGMEGNPVPLVHFLPALTKRGFVPKKGPSRNAPCPCGSGKQYKRCCG